MRSMRRLLVDSSAWVMFYLGEPRERDSVTRLFLLARERGIDLLYSPLTACEVFRLVVCWLCRLDAQGGAREGRVSEAAAREVAWGCVRNMGEIATAVGEDQSDVWAAQKLARIHDDFADNLVISAAERADADLVVTYREELLGISAIAAAKPEDAMALLA